MNGMPRSHGPTRPPASIVRCAKSGPKSTGPQIAPETAPKSTNDIPRARRSGGNISAAAARARRTIDADPPTSARPRQTRKADVAAQPPATVPQPMPPSTKPPRITGMRPVRSINRPAGPTAIAPAARKIAGPSPRMPLTPVTATSVRELSAAASWNAPELQTSEPASRKALRRTSALTGRVYAAGPRRTRAAPPCDGWRTYGAVEHLCCEPPDGDDPPPARQLVEKRTRRPHLGARRTSIRRRRAGMCRHDVPEQHVVDDTKLAQNALHDRRTRLGGACAGQLPLRGERNAADARSAIAGGLADENHLCVRAGREIVAQPRAAQLRPRVLRTGCVSFRCSRLPGGLRNPWLPLVPNRDPEPELTRSVSEGGARVAPGWRSHHGATGEASVQSIESENSTEHTGDRALRCAQFRLHPR